MNKRLRYLIGHRAGPKKGTGELAAQLAPLEEQAKQIVSSSGSTIDENNRAIIQQPGAIIIDNQGLSLSDDIAEGNHGKQILGMEPVALAILGFMIAFIVFIAWQISLMPVE